MRLRVRVLVKSQYLSECESEGERGRVSEGVKTRGRE